MVDAGLRRPASGTRQGFQEGHPLQGLRQVGSLVRGAGAAHRQCTGAIITRETDLNAHVYALFGLAAEETALIEAVTKYKYGEV